MIGRGLRSTLRGVLVAVWVTGLTTDALAQGTETSAPPNTGFQIAPRGYVQFDWRGFPDWPVTPGTGRLTYDTLEVRRARVGVDGSWGRLSYEFTVDPQDLDDTLVRDAYGRWRFTRAFQVQVGQFKLPGSREYLAAARNLDFMERSALAQFVAPGRDAGAMLHGEIGRVEYQTGVFVGDGRGRGVQEEAPVEGPILISDGRSRGSRSGLTSASRVVWNPPGDLEFGGSLSVGHTSAVDEDPANGIEGRTTSGYRFFERVYVEGMRVRLGGDLTWSPGPWRVAVEGIRVTDARNGQGLDFEDLPSVQSLGYSVSLVRQLGRRGGGQSRSRLREVDLGIRLDGLHFDDTGPDTGQSSTRPRATDIRARGATSVTMTASWQPTRWTRVIGSGGVDTFTDARSAPEPGRSGGYWSAGTRLQIELP
ncbi:MAG TPA: porin [Vicinamibacterales bacterium]